MVGFQKRFSPVFQKAKELILQDVLGSPIFFRAYCLSSDVLREGSAWRSRRGSGGVLLDLAPHLLDLEVGQVLRRLAREGAVSAQRGEEAIQDLLDLRVTRYPHFVLLPRIWQLRDNLSAYDAAYVALAEELDATLLTRDARLVSAPGHSAQVEVF